ncbi:hypothetical protein B0H16DRAFT_518854 [Mycena metata]|uniref:Uncharacterized protein n=1 Tax=Mycena metata TaxID=1033252 RepID=A0AAD7JFJ4_9AGAR|nr:hypothetical protein B0H16DRAFT_518854 [Mycena metata]
MAGGGVERLGSRREREFFGEKAWFVVLTLGGSGRATARVCGICAGAGDHVPGPRVEWVRLALAANARARGVSCARRWSVWAAGPAWAHAEACVSVREGCGCTCTTGVLCVCATGARYGGYRTQSSRGRWACARDVSRSSSRLILFSSGSGISDSAYSRRRCAHRVSVSPQRRRRAYGPLPQAGRASTEVSALRTLRLILIGACAAVGGSAEDVCVRYTRLCGGVRRGSVAFGGDSFLVRVWALGARAVHLYAACRMDGELVESALSLRWKRARRTSLEMYEDVCDGVGMHSSARGAVRNERLGRGHGEDAFGRLGACR